MIRLPKKTSGPQLSVHSHGIYQYVWAILVFKIHFFFISKESIIDFIKHPENYGERCYYC